MYKIAVLGDYDSIYGFATVGLDTFPVSDTEEAVRQLHNLAENDYSVIYVTEELAARISEAIEKYSASVLPAIIQIPGVYGNTGAGILNVKKTVEQAVGSDILFGGNEKGV